MSAHRGFAPIALFIILGTLTLTAILIFKSDFLHTFKYSPLFLATQPVNLPQTPLQESQNSPACDVNSDGKCNVADLDLLKRALGTSRGQKGYNPLTDFDANGVMNEVDQQILLNLLSQNQIDETAANWKTYTNQRYKFSFKYPPTWELPSDVKDAYPEEDVVVIVNEFDEITLSIKENVKDVAEAEKIVCGPPACGGIKFKDTRLGNTVLRTPDIIPEPEIINNGWASYLLKEEILYNFFLKTDNQDPIEDLKIFDQILSTFQFLD